MALKNQTVLQQNVWQPGLTSINPIRDISSTTIPSHLCDMQGPPSLDLNLDTLGISNLFVDLEDSALLHMDFDVITLPANHNNCLGSDLVILQFNQININSHLVGEDQRAACQGGDDKQEDFLDKDTFPGDQDLDSMDKHTVLPPSEPTEDDTDPFLVDQQPVHPITNISELPKHLLAIYTIVSWLHIQFNLPQVACNALLEILVCLVIFFSTQLA